MAEPTPKPKSDPVSKKILIVDDDESIRNMLESTLSLEGFKVKTSRDARNILNVALEFEPDLIVSDMMMPGGGGYELFHVLQGDSITRQIPIFLMSGHGFDASTKDMFKQESNVVGFFDKPIRPSQFLSAIHKVLNTKSREEKMVEENQKKMGQIERNKYEDLF